MAPACGGDPAAVVLMSAFLAAVAAIAAYQFGAAFLPLYLGRGRHRRLSPAAQLRAMRARRVRVRVHDPIPQHLLIADDARIDAAGAAARRDATRLLADLAVFGV